MVRVPELSVKAPLVPEPVALTPYPFVVVLLYRQRLWLCLASAPKLVSVPNGTSTNFVILTCWQAPAAAHPVKRRAAASLAALKLTPAERIIA